MRRFAIFVMVLTTAAAPLAALCGLDCGVQTAEAAHAAAQDAECPLHEPPAPAEHHHTCDHDHHVAPATAKADSSAAGRDVAVDVSLQQPTHVVVNISEPTSTSGLGSPARPPRRLFALRI